MSCKVSIIVPVYNGEAFLRECLDSVRQQTMTDFEVICIDDGSADPSAEILREYAEKDPRFKAICRENRGVSATRNEGLALAQGDYILTLDCDDLYPSRHVLEAMVEAAEAQNADIVGGSLGEFFPDGRKILEFSGKKSGYTFTRNGWLDFSDFAFEYGCPRFLFRRSLLKQYKLCYPPYRAYEDPVFLVKVMAVTKKFYAIPDLVYLYRQREKQIAYTADKIRDIVCGGCDIMFMAYDNGFTKLHEKYATQFFGDFSEENAVGSLCMKMIVAGDETVTDRLFQTSLEANDDRLLPPLQKILGKDVKASHFSRTYFRSSEWRSRIKRYELRRKVRGFFTCLAENGLSYTLKRLFVH